MHKPVLTILLALLAGFAGAAAWDYSGLGPDRTRAALMADPGMLPDAMAELQRRDAVQRLAPIRAEVKEPFPGAVLGNPQGSTTMVEFTDYACGFCRSSLADVQQLIAEDPDLRIVIREYPVLSDASVEAARMALAAAQQGRYEAFHASMFAADGLTTATIEAAATRAGVDLARARAAIASGDLDAQLQNNHFLARNLGLSGTPAFVIGDEVLNGAVGADALRGAIAEARDS